MPPCLGKYQRKVAHDTLHSTCWCFIGWKYNSWPTCCPLAWKQSHFQSNHPHYHSAVGCQRNMLLRCFHLVTDSLPMGKNRWAFASSCVKFSLNKVMHTKFLLWSSLASGYGSKRPLLQLVGIPRQIARCQMRHRLFLVSSHKTQPGFKMQKHSYIVITTETNICPSIMYN